MFGAYEELVPQISVGEVGTLFVGSHGGGRRLENALDALRTVFVGSSSNDANSTPTDIQEPIFANLQLLRASAEFQAAKSNVRLVTPSSSFADESIINSQEAMAYRYALLELLPFAVVANSEALNQMLYGAYPTRLSLHNTTTGTGSLTEQWLRDRAAMAETLFVANSRSLPIYYDPTSQTNWTYEDLSTEE
ncbi:hypothetical protein BurJ1DRAFT_0113 [Burkholderiales bacterium JOSHI_001]|nr:hypothetical protein BurJ1DRAFT_0113 [Burkholderiales bacterium JOSHI_001]